MWRVLATASSVQLRGALPAGKALRSKLTVLNASAVCVAVQRVMVAMLPLAQVAALMRVLKWSAGHANCALMLIVSRAQAAAVKCASQAITSVTHSFAC